MNFQRATVRNIINVTNIIWDTVEHNPSIQINFALKFEVTQPLPVNIISQFVNYQT